MRKPFFSILICLFFHSLSAQEVTVESLLSAPHLTNLTVSPTGDKIVWVENVKGVRNIQYAVPLPKGTPQEQYKPNILTNFDKDDGIDITHVEWSQDEKSLFFVKGNAPQVRGTQPHNPSHAMDGTAPTIWQLDVEKKIMTKIGNGSNPFISPNGEKLIFTRGGHPYELLMLEE